MSQKVTKAVLPVAGLGTRFLPATKAVPKEVLPLVDKPLIQYAIDEAREAGIEQFIFVTSRGKSALEDYFDRSPELERALQEGGKDDLMDVMRRTEMPSGAIAYIRQQRPRGLGHAVRCAHHLIGNEPFAVILPDDVIAAETPCLKQMIDAHAEVGGNMVATMEVSPEKTSSYGIVDPSAVDGRLINVKGLVEKPRVNDAPSNYAVIGRYILTPAVLEALDGANEGAGGEIQLTDAIAAQVDSPDGVTAYRFEGQRFDCGSKIGFLQATVAFGLAREDLGDEFGAYLSEIVGLNRAAE